MIITAERFDIKIMGDLVINHCAADSGLITSHSEWFVRVNNSSSLLGPFYHGRKQFYSECANK